MADKEYKVKIVTVGDPAGANAVADSLDKVNKAARKSKDDSKEAGDAIETFGKKGAAAQDAFEGMSRVANGGAGAIFGFAKAWRALTEAFLANPITATLAALLALLPLIKAGFDAFASSMEASKNQLFGTGQATALLEANLKKAEEAAKKTGETMKLAAESANTEWERINRNIEDAARRLEQLAEADKERALAQVDVDEAQQLDEAARSGTVNSAELAALIKERAAQRRVAINNTSDVDRREREEAVAIQKRASADRTIGQAEGQIGGAQAAVNQLTSQLALLIQRGKEAASISESITAQQILAETKQTRDDLKGATKNLADLTKQLTPTLEGARRQRADANATLSAAEVRRQAQVLRGRAGDLEQTNERKDIQGDVYYSQLFDKAGTVDRVLSNTRNVAGSSDPKIAALIAIIRQRDADIRKNGTDGPEQIDALVLALSEFLVATKQIGGFSTTTQIKQLTQELRTLAEQVRGLRTR